MKENWCEDCKHWTPSTFFFVKNIDKGHCDCVGYETLFDDNCCNFERKITQEKRTMKLGFEDLIPKKSIVMRIHEKLTKMLIKLVGFLSKCIPTIALAVRSAIYTAAFIYVVAPRIPQLKDHQFIFVDLWTSVFVIIFVIRMEHRVNHGSTLVESERKLKEKKNER